MAENLELLLGSYEEYLLAFKVSNQIDDKGNRKLIPTIATHSHTGSIRSIAAGGKYAVTGGTDDKIFIYNMVTRRETSMLTYHNGTINTMKFTPDASHLIAGSTDGEITIVQCSNWELVLKMKQAHGGFPVTWISVHPSGKLALSLGGDLTMRTWNLIKGRRAYATNLKNKPNLGKTIEFVEWSPSGEYFVLSGTVNIEIWEVASSSMCKTYACPARPTSLVWASDDRLIVGLENGKVMIVNTDSNDEPTLFEMYKQRVKGLAVKNGYVASICSTGEVNLWSFDADKQTFQSISSGNAKCRPTAITMIDTAEVLKLKTEQEPAQIIAKDKSLTEDIPISASRPLPRGKVEIIEEKDYESSASDEDTSAKFSSTGSKKKLQSTPSKKSSNKTKIELKSGVKKSKAKKRKSK